jgi:predicted RecB family nuclease
MTPHETAVLLEHGVTMDTLDALGRAGITTLAQLADRDRGQLADVPAVGPAGADTIVRALGRLIDLRYSTK